MFKKIIFIVIALLAIKYLPAQNINFTKGGWQQILSSAKTENKLVFVDIYAVWCGPCKAMSKNVFTNPKVAEKFNASFINYMVDAEKGEGIILTKKYEVTSFPTYLFVDAAGNLVYKIEGALTADKFCLEADAALNKNNRIR